MSSSNLSNSTLTATSGNGKQPICGEWYVYCMVYFTVLGLGLLCSFANICRQALHPSKRPRRPQARHVNGELAVVIRISSLSASQLTEELPAAQPIPAVQSVV